MNDPMMKAMLSMQIAQVLEKSYPLMATQGYGPPDTAFIGEHIVINYEEVVQRCKRLIEDDASNPLYDVWREYYEESQAILAEHPHVRVGDANYLFLCRMEDEMMWWKNAIALLRTVHPTASISTNTRSRLQNLAWAVPTLEVIEYILDVCKEQDRELVELGAGTGYWLRLLRRISVQSQRNVQCFGYDIKPMSGSDRLSNVKRGDEKTVLARKNPANILLCYPPQEIHGHSDMSANIARDWTSGDLFYVGEQTYIDDVMSGGKRVCMSTGTDEFFDILEKDWELVKKIDLPKWPGIFDNFYHYRR